MNTQTYPQLYPLGETSELDLRGLSQALWRWHECPGAHGTHGSNSHCGESGEACPWRRYDVLAQFHKVYRELATTYVPELDYGTLPALRGHGDLLDIIRCLKDNPESSRAQLMSEHFGTRHAADKTGPGMPTQEDQVRASGLAARVMTAGACSGEDVESAVLELGTEPITWGEELSLSQFLLAAFPLAHTLSLGSTSGTGRHQGVRSLLAAETITKIGRFDVQPTDGLRSHLNLDSKWRTQPSVLKEHLRATKSLSTTAGVAEEIRIGDNPRQLALEVLDSINLLFPPPTSESHAILRRLVSKGQFNKNMLHLETRDLRHKHEVEGEYRSLASKLWDLYDEVENPTPRGRFERWFERQVAQR
ncbi:hypothetical protein N658DRAFT_561336 [Parathielavia hyrcaniae]|uniref:Uncharacterized protein n=1 Tax=Parathielavia hyrcaniae TaxID=113614 RepID=A0AAN6SYV6_9PEZI|nr:hypothetical protein N658DRAFT_561336 [Parathielavia hyrcaniae]